MNCSYKTFIDRFPYMKGMQLWCAECGEDICADELNWYQLCPTCVQWWLDNPPPSELDDKRKD